MKFRGKQYVANRQGFNYLVEIADQENMYSPDRTLRQNGFCPSSGLGQQYKPMCFVTIKSNGVTSRGLYFARINAGLSMIG